MGLEGREAYLRPDAGLWLLRLLEYPCHCLGGFVWVSGLLWLSEG